MREHRASRNTVAYISLHIPIHSDVWSRSACQNVTALSRPALIYTPAERGEGRVREQLWRDFPNTSSRSFVRASFSSITSFRAPTEKLRSVQKIGTPSLNLETRSSCFAVMSSSLIASLPPATRGLTGALIGFSLTLAVLRLTLTEDKLHVITWSRNDSAVSFPWIVLVPGQSFFYPW